MHLFWIIHRDKYHMFDIPSSNFNRSFSTLVSFSTSTNASLVLACLTATIGLKTSGFHRHLLVWAKKILRREIIQNSVQLPTVEANSCNVSSPSTFKITTFPVKSIKAIFVPSASKSKLTTLPIGWKVIERTRIKAVSITYFLILWAISLFE